MIRLLGAIPDRVYLACSGGTDSMVALDFLLNGRKDVHVLYFNHGTAHGADAENFVRARCKVLGLCVSVGNISRERQSGESKEEFWRNQRYDFFRKFDGPIVTSHHLDDCVETWIFTSLHGKPKTIPYRNGNVIRPFLLTKKSSLNLWRERRSVEVLEDPSNYDVSYMRNHIRHNIVPPALVVNPGLHKVVSKIVRESYNAESRRDNREADT